MKNDGWTGLNPRPGMGSRITRTGEGAEYVPPANSAPMKTRDSIFLWEVGWLKISIVGSFGDPRLISSRPKNSKLKIYPKFCKNADLRVFRTGRKTIIARSDL